MTDNAGPERGMPPGGQGKEAPNSPELDYLHFQNETGHQVEMVISATIWNEQQSPQNAVDFSAIAKAAFLALEQIPVINRIEIDPEFSYHITILFEDDEAVTALNKTYRNKEAPTNVLSFPAEDLSPENNLSHLGDAILAYKTVKAEADRDKKALNTHICHLVIHAVLHLLGYDHETDSKADAMEMLESELMNRLGYDNPYAL